MFKRFLQSEGGNLAPTFAVALLPVVGLSGAAVDYSRASALRNVLQAAADAAALHGATAAGASDAHRVAVAEAVVKARHPDATAQASVASDRVSVLATGTIKTTTLGALRIDKIAVEAKATAVKGRNGPPACVVALNRTVSGAVTFGGNASFAADGCMVQSNSAHASGLVFEGSTTASAAGFCSAGGVAASRTITPEPRRNCPPVDDPFRNLSAPVTTGCTYPSLVEVEPSQTRTLSPGIYCGGLTLKGTVTFQPGTYVIKNGRLTINSQARLTGEGVTFYLTGTGAGFTINGGSDVRLSAPKDGTYGGMLIVQDRASNPDFTNTLNGNASTVLAGAIYTPTQRITVSGTGGFGQASQLMPLVADQLKFTGNSVTKVDLTGIQMAAPLPKDQGEARLVE
ncbi:MAG TPA: pilus assembly protein TadG-related protein [Beijerinckiaceae bacterium]|nr:pilus assembly protein TadG-related protein [Beijerinckiaceae bacterium]